MSDNPISRPSVLTKSDIDRLLTAIENRGGNINISDPRVTQIQTYVISCVGIVLLGLGGWLVNSINTLNTTMQRVVTTNEYTVKAIDDHTRRLEDLERERRHAP